jgi:radical SAM superfamily enzyme YgiQ (UPF0313 family)
MLRTLLINCPTPDFITNREFMMPPSLLYLAGTLDSHNIPTAILDLNVTRSVGQEDESIIDSTLRDFCPDLVGIGCLFSGHFPTVVKICQTIKQHSPNSKTVVGGIHPTLFPKEILEHVPEIDYVIIGEGEASLLTLASNWMPLLEGIAFRTPNQHIKVLPKTSFISNLDELPRPAYNLIDISGYAQDFSHWHNPKNLNFSINVPIISTRSCPRRCNFCSMRFVMGETIRYRTPQHVVDEIEFLYYTYGLNRFSFQDDNLTLNKKHIVGICQGILDRKLNIQWEANNGLMVRSLSEDVIDLAVQSGMIRVFMAIESGNDYIRNKIMRKNLPKKDIYRVSTYIKDNYPHVFLRGLFIMGMPEETQDTLEDTYKMLLELPLDDFSIANLMPFPGTDVYQQVLRDDLLINTTFDNMWQEIRMDFNDNSTFYVRPYNMSETQLHSYRTKFDELRDQYD